MAECVVMERLVRGRPPGREFDVVKINFDYKSLLSIFNAAVAQPLMAAATALLPSLDASWNGNTAFPRYFTLS
jgi:hypothetical protein